MLQENIAVVFPGQGSQRHGMGNDFYDNVPTSRHTYEEASDALGWDVAGMCFGEDNRLNLTEYAQPCILTTEIAMLRGLRSLYDFSPDYFGGHSLGEYTALVAADVMPLAEALQVAHVRGQLMQQASPIGVGSMAAIISNDLNMGILHDTLKDLPIDIANINSANQVVISGKSESMPVVEKRLREAIKENGAFRFVPLNVSAPFHSHFMDTVKDAFKDLLRNIAMKLKPINAQKVTSNFTGLLHSGSRNEIIEGLVSQFSGTVQWKKNMDTLISYADSIFEIGPGRPLRDFFKTIGYGCTSITTLSSAKRVFEKANRVTNISQVPVTERIFEKASEHCGL